MAPAAGEDLNVSALSLFVCSSFYRSSCRCQHAAPMMTVAGRAVEHAESFGFARHCSELLRVASVRPHVETAGNRGI
jgi:hypothetical protein